MDHHGKVLGEPSLLVDLAFSHPDGFEATHTKSQQEAPRWLFARCRRLPSQLRQECGLFTDQYAATSAARPKTTWSSRWYTP